MATVARARRPRGRFVGVCGRSAGRVGDGRLKQVAATIRPSVAEWSAKRPARLDTAVSAEIHPGPRDGGNPMDPNRPASQLKRYIAARPQRVRAQLDGKEQGVIVNPRQN
jgi:hypothetical protein